MKKITLVCTLVFGLCSLQANAFDILHPIRSAEKALVVGAVGYVTIKATADYLIEHPNTIANWLSTHPNEVEPLTKYVDKKIDNAKTQEDYDKYSNLKQQLALDIDQNIAEDLAVENDPIYKSLETEVRNEIQIIDATLVQNNQMPNYCSVNVISQLIMNRKQFETTVNNVDLPQLQSLVNKTSILDVNTFKRLKDGYKNSDKSLSLEQDHIPSYAAIDKYLINHGISTKTTYRTNSNGKKETVRDIDLEGNETAISTPKEIHMLGRTYGGRNYTAKINNDSQNLFEATVKDLATTAYWFSKNNQYNITAQDYIKSSMYIYTRNKVLCLYDVK